jgi:uncharacterized membrane protein YphA (DoxX/SURF4 family)
MTTAASRPPSGKVSRFAALGARLILGGVFVYLGLVKAQAPVEFLKLLREYHLVQSPMLLNLVAATLPWVEIVCGLCLVAGVALRGAAVAALVMLIPFSLAVLQRALGIQAAEGVPFCSIRFDCGCGAGVVVICDKLIENGSLILLATAILVTRPRAWALKASLFRDS